MKKRYSILLNLVVIGLMIFVLKDINFTEVLSLLKQINLFWFGAAFVSLGLMFVLWNFRFRNTLSGMLGPKKDFFYFFKVLFSGIFINTITPGSNVGGEPVRAYFLNKKFKRQKSKFLGVVFADKFFNMFVFGLFLIFSILFVLIYIKLPFVLKIIFEVLLLSIVLISVILIYFNFKKINFNFSGILKKIYKFKIIQKKFEKFEKFESYIVRRIRNLVRFFKKGILNKRIFLIGILLSFLGWILNYSASYFLFFAFDIRVSFLSVIIVMTLSYAIGDLSPIPGGIGLVESSMFLLYSAMGVTGSLAITVVLLSRIIYYFYALVLGGLSFAYLKLKY
jgi:glycosyltransferase 2 family protein